MTIIIKSKKNPEPIGSGFIYFKKFIYFKVLMPF